MLFRHQPPRAPAVRRQQRGVVWLVAMALCVYACSGAMLRVLGPAHWHAAAEPVAAASPLEHPVPGHSVLAEWLGRIHALSEQAHAQAHVLGIAPHQHSHSGLLRHWHSHDDDTVRTVAGDPAAPELADLKAAAAIGGAMLVPALGAPARWQACAQANGTWPASPAPRWHSADMAPPVEPPIA